MTGQGERWTPEQVLALAPDDASRRAGGKLASSAAWPETGEGAGAVWGLCKGSGSRPYQTVVDLDGANGPGYTCSCPSRKFPCKHVLGLLLLWAGEEVDQPGGARAVREAEPPEWASSWLEGRRARTVRKAPALDGPGTEGDGSAHGVAEGGSAASSAERQAARRRAERAQRMAAGAQDLEERLADMVRAGLAGADQRGWTEWEQVAARMVDAQARGLADRVRELGAIPAAGSGPGAGSGTGAQRESWPERLLSELGLLHLLDQALIGVDELPGPLAATVRSRAGLTPDSAEVLADESARVRDEWLVLAQRDTLDTYRLTSRRIWLHGRSSDRSALLLSFGAAGRSPALSLPVGAVLDAELAYYPGALRLRAALGERHGTVRPGFLPRGGPVHAALAAYATALCSDPWLESWPVVLRDVLPIPFEDAADGWQVADAEGESALPVVPGTDSSALWKLMAISADGPVTVFGECGHRGFAPYAAWCAGDEGGDGNDGAGAGPEVVQL